MDERDFQAIREEWMLAANSLKDSYRDFDKLILTLSSASIAASAYLFKDVIDRKLPLQTELWMIRISVGASIVSLIFILISYIWGIRSFRRAMSSLSKEVSGEIKTNEDDFLPTIKWGNRMNVCAGIAFFIALAFDALFIFFYY